MEVGSPLTSKNSTPPERMWDDSPVNMEAVPQRRTATDIKGLSAAEMLLT